MSIQRNRNNKKQKSILYRLFFSVAVTLIIVFLVFVGMLKWDEYNFRKMAAQKNEKLMQTLNEVETKERDYLLARSKTLLLDFVEEDNARWQYGALVDRENKVKISSMEALRIQINKISTFVTYYWCDSEAYLEWLRNGGDERKKEISADGEEASYLFYKMDALFAKGGLIVPTTVYFNKVQMKEDARGDIHPIYDYNDILRYDLALDDRDYSEYEEIELRVNDTAGIFSNPTKGNPASDAVFLRVNEVCEPIEHSRRVGDVEVVFSQSTRTKSYEMRTYIGTNVILDAKNRYIAVLSVTGGAAFALLFPISLLNYWRRKNQYNQDLYRQNLMNSLAHDLKTPLAAMSGYAENLIDDVQADKREHYASAIKDNVEYMNSIIMNVMLLAESENRKISGKDRIELVSLCKELWTKYELMANERQIKAAFSGSFEMRGDRNLMISAMDNLLTNAVKYAKTGSVVSVKGENGRFTISNLCEKAPETEPAHLWEPFVKGDNSRGQRKGSGLGLSIVKNICDIHRLKAEISWEENVFTITIR